MRQLRPIHYLMLTPAQALVTLALAGPAVYVACLSFTSSDFGRNIQFVGLDNYRKILSDRYFWQAALNTFLIVNFVVYAELLLGLATAKLVASVTRGRTLLFSIVLAPYAISEVVAVLAWRFLADPRLGLITRVLESIGLPRLDWTSDPNVALGLISTISVWLHLPFSFVLLYAAIISVPREITEAAHIDGARPFQEFWYVTLPIIAPAAMIAIVFRYIFAFRMFSEVWLVTQGGPIRSTEVLGTYLYRAGFRYSDYGAAAAVGWLMVVGSVLLAALYIHAMYRRMFKFD